MAATQAVNGYTIEDDDSQKPKPASGFTIGDVGPVTRGPDPAVMAASRARNAQQTQFEKDNGMGTAGRALTEGTLGLVSSAAGTPETMHPVRDAIVGGITNLKNRITNPNVSEELLNGITSGGYGTAMDAINMGHEFAGRQPGESTQDVIARRAHAVGTVAGKVIPLIAGEAIDQSGLGNQARQTAAEIGRTPNNTPRLGFRIATKAILPHWLAGEGLASEALDTALPMRTELDTAGRPYTPPNPTERARLETDAAQRTEIMNRTRAAEEAKAQDVHDTNELNRKAAVAQRKAEMARATDIDATNKLNQKAAEDAAAKKEAADQQFIKEGRAVPLTRNPTITPEKIASYEAGQQQMTPEQVAAAKNPVIPSIITPQTQIEATKISEGRPATWTNESLPSTIMNREAPMAAKRAAIQQMVVRNRELPPNARYLAGDASFGAGGESNPKSVTIFGPEGQPIDTTPSPLIQPIAPRPGAGIPRIADMADEYIRSLGATTHPEVEHGTELTGPNASGESAVSREALARKAAENARGEQRIRIDTRSGKEIPLVSAEDIDAKPGPHDVIVKRGPQGETVIDRGANANYRPGQKPAAAAGKVSESVERPNTYELGEEEPAQKKTKKIRR